MFNAKTIRIEPPLTISQAELDQSLAIMDRVFKEVNNRHFSPERVPVRK